MNIPKTIKALSESYLGQKRILEDQNNNNIKRPYESLVSARYIVNRIETVINDLSENDYFIIYNEVILGKRGKWFIGYLSQATYYRHRKIAYKNFIARLD